MSEVQTALFGALRDLQHPGDDRTAVVRQTDAELHGPGVYHHGDAGRRVARSVNRSSGEPASLDRFLVICFRQRIVATDPNPTDVCNSSLRRSGRDASRWFGLRQCQDQTDNIMKLGIVLPYSGADMSIPIDRVLEAERLGFDSVWTSEAYGSDAVTPAAWVLARTTR